MTAILRRHRIAIPELGEARGSSLRACCRRKGALRAAAALEHVTAVPRRRQTHFEPRAIKLGGREGRRARRSGEASAGLQSALYLAMLWQRVGAGGGGNELGECDGRTPRRRG